MGEKAFECADILKPLLKKYLIIGFSLVIAINITINVAGFCCIYYKLKKKIYHTHFMTRGTLEKLHNVDITLDKCTGQMEIKKH